MSEPASHNLMWNMTRKCNFACDYCYFPPDHTPVDEILDVDELVGMLDATGHEWTVGLTGGEPLLYPDFVEICRKLTKGHRIALDSNLSVSSRVREFAEAVDPARVKDIYASLHIEERERKGGVDAFVENVRLLKDKGFVVKVNYVVHPRLVERFPEDRERFRGMGVEIVPRPFKGEFEGRRYPESYGESAREVFGEYPEAGRKMVFNFQGVPCDGGRSFVRMEPDGAVFRCSGDKSVIGRLGEGVRLNEEALPCAVAKCPCRGLDHVHLTEAQQVFVDGLMYVNVGDFPAAEQAFSRTLELDPDHAGAVNNLGVLAWKRGKSGEAQAHFIQAHELCPDNGLFRDNLAVARHGTEGGGAAGPSLCNQAIPQGCAEGARGV